MIPRHSIKSDLIHNLFCKYGAGQRIVCTNRLRERQLRSFQLNLDLSTIFPPKQKELVLKKLNGEPLTKTEQEYYSRIVKKKLEALANSEIRKIASSLTKK